MLRWPKIVNNLPVCLKIYEQHTPTHLQPCTCRFAIEFRFSSTTGKTKSLVCSVQCARNLPCLARGETSTRITKSDKSLSPTDGTKYLCSVYLAVFKSKRLYIPEQECYRPIQHFHTAHAIVSESAVTLPRVPVVPVLLKGTVFDGCSYLVIQSLSYPGRT